MRKDYIMELTPPTSEEIRNARQLATVLPEDALAHAMLIAATVCAGKKMIALCRKAGAQPFPDGSETGDWANRFGPID